MTGAASEHELKAEITRLETLLSIARSAPPIPHPSSPPKPCSSPQQQQHTLLLLSDSALPLGSFAFSSGLESHLAHTPRLPSSSSLLPSFLSLSIHSLCTTTLPYLLAAHASPSRLAALDAELDACTLCPVARRASIAQGRALLTLWDRAFREGGGAGNKEAAGGEEEKDDGGARKALAVFSTAMKSAGNRPYTYGAAGDEEGLEALLTAPNGHFGPLWAVVTRAQGISAHDALYVFLLNHAKAVTSAAVRASVMGPYEAQGLLGSAWLRGEIARVMTSDVQDEGKGYRVEDAGQGVPALDLWVGRHELLYSRIFNS